MSDIGPGIRETARRLREAGFEAAEGAATEATSPRVTIRCAPLRLVEETRRLFDLLTDNWIAAEPVGRGPVWIQARYDPADDVATIVLAGIGDASWPLP